MDTPEIHFHFNADRTKKIKVKQWRALSRLRNGDAPEPDFIIPIMALFMQNGDNNYLELSEAEARLDDLEIGQLETLIPQFMEGFSHMAIPLPSGNGSGPAAESHGSAHS